MLTIKFVSQHKVTKNCIHSDSHTFSCDDEDTLVKLIDSILREQIRNISKMLPEYRVFAVISKH